MKNKQAIIFGANGQDGFYLTQLLEKNAVEVIRVSRSGSGITGNIRDLEFVRSTISKYQPDFIFHLAANSTTRHDALFENHETISTGTLNLLESVRLYCPAAKVFISGTALQFKNGGHPIDELAPFDASSAYSVARIQSVYAARYFRNNFSLKIYVGYFFNHDSPLRTEQHVNQKIVKAVNRIAAGSKEKLVIGNLDVEKEFNYAGDIVNAVWKLINQEDFFEAVLGSGLSYAIRDWVDCCFQKRNLNWQDHVQTDPGFKAEYKRLVCNPQLIKSTGWFPETGMHQLAEMMLNS